MLGRYLHCREELGSSLSPLPQDKIPLSPISLSHTRSPALTDQHIRLRRPLRTSLIIEARRNQDYSKIIQLILMNKSTLTEITIRGFHEATLRWMRKFLPLLRSLKKIRFEKDLSRPFPSILPLQQNPALEVLQSNLSGFVDFGPKQKGLRRLAVTKVSTLAFEQKHQRLPNLGRFGIYGSLQSLALHLKVSKETDGEKIHGQITGLSKILSLKDLTIFLDDPSGDQLFLIMIKTVADLPKLTNLSLILSGAQSFSFYSVMKTHPNPFPTLKVLECQGLDIQNDLLPKVLERLKLKKLSISKMALPGLAKLCRMCLSLTTLESFSLSNFRLLDDIQSDLSPIFTHAKEISIRFGKTAMEGLQELPFLDAPNLQKLTLEGLWRNSLQHLSGNFPSLISLDLGTVLMNSEKHPRALPRLSELVPNLQELKCVLYVSLAYQEAERFRVDFPVLRSLNLEIIGYKAGVSPIVTFLHGIPQVEEVYFHFHNKNTGEQPYGDEKDEEQAVIKAISRMKSLRTLVLKTCDYKPTNCPTRTEGYLDRLASRLEKTNGMRFLPIRRGPPMAQFPWSPTQWDLILSTK